MAIAFQSKNFIMSPHTGSEVDETHRFDFPSRVNSAVSSLSGVAMGFTGADRNLKRLRAYTGVSSVSGNSVFVKLEFALRDGSGEYDDEFDGIVGITVIAELA